jgi:hypothetical protein
MPSSMSGASMSDPMRGTYPSSPSSMNPTSGSTMPTLTRTSGDAGIAPSRPPLDGPGVSTGPALRSGSPDVYSVPPRTGSMPSAPGMTSPQPVPPPGPSSLPLDTSTSHYSVPTPPPLPPPPSVPTMPTASQMVP